jgi:EmrB/QacA subfamily drug resistance transporter
MRLKSGAGRWAVAATVLGSGAVFLEMTVMTVALPVIGRDLDLGLAGLQWLLNAYLLPLSALILLGGSLGDRHGRRRVFVVGLIGFATASALCMVAPGFGTLVACRLLQGIFGALLVPNSLAILDTLFAEEDRGAAIGQWAAWSGVSTALGPLIGGWLADALSWRWVFACVVPFALAAAWIAARRMPADEPAGAGAVDYAGAVLVTLGLAGVTAALVAGPSLGGAAGEAAAGGGGLILLAAFVLVERRVRGPLLPLELFRSRQFSGTNLVTLLVYAALGGFFFLFVLMLQDALGYSALASGAALLPVNLLMLLVSPRAGRWSARVGARLPMTVGATVAAGGLLLLSSAGPGARYLTGLVPGALRNRPRDAGGSAHGRGTWGGAGGADRRRFGREQRHGEAGGTARYGRAAAGRGPRWGEGAPRGRAGRWSGHGTPNQRGPLPGRGGRGVSDGSGQCAGGGDGASQPDPGLQPAGTSPGGVTRGRGIAGVDTRV